MANSLADLAARLEKLATEVESATVKPSTDCALAIVEYLAYNTPVDTSMALSNWQVFIGGYPVGNQIQPHYFGFGGTTQKVSAEKTIKLAKEKLETKKAGETIYIANFKAYIKVLNERGGKYLPPGFVDKALLQGKLKIRN